MEILDKLGINGKILLAQVVNFFLLMYILKRYLYQPLLQPSTAGMCATFEEMGFFFSGLRHGRGGEDWLVLQYLNNQRYDYSLLKAATSFGQELIDYVRERDPVCCL